MRNCPTCGSNTPSRHPAMQFGGEVQPCDNLFHLLCDACFYIKGLKQPEPNARGVKSDYRPETCNVCGGVHWEDWSRD